ncbi:hypothetical protein RQP54_17905 [Curvibacter sp. APW13]|uniref:hypothetical protein n=1 Tax=Curvibacter sp. APW13 TaxID=3077236 RepID=UPI0028DE2422|nr:hypothetical protein [Curvibacter sp. APW13]MDT8992752.1 hypothetical protein [Curvibacter sp. APW13]
MSINPKDQQELAVLVLAMKRDVLEMIRDGQVPLDVQNFSQLHDYCDANCLGGLCTDQKFDALVAKFGGRDADDGMPQGMLDFINAAQNTISEWVQAGGHTILDKLPAKVKSQIQDTLSNNDVSDDAQIVEFWVSECGIALEAANMAILFRANHLTDPLYQFFSHSELQGD